MKAPVPMPKLKMPEKMLIATAVPSCGANFMISSCIATLNAVPANPHRASTAKVTSMLKEAGNTRKIHAAMMARRMVRNEKR